MKEILKVKDLAVEFKTPEGLLTAPDGVSFGLNQGEVLGIVGESGSGKSVSALAVMGLIPTSNGRIKSGEITYMDRDLRKEINSIRGKEISMVFQNPLNSLNPSLKIGLQLTEVLTAHTKKSKYEATIEAVEIMDKLGIPSPEKLMNRYPFEYSGGMRQRIMIAMAMLCNPKILIADEPTTALDVTIQSQILHLFLQLKENFDTSLIFITHDLGVIAQIADRVMVMYAGKQMEIASVSDLYEHPKHPYTKELLKSIPALDSEHRKEKLPSIKGNVPSLIKPPEGCRFHPRCKFAKEICKKKSPVKRRVNDTDVWCWLYEEEDKND